MDGIAQCALCDGPGAGARRVEKATPRSPKLPLLLSATDPHTQANIGRSTEDSGPTRHSKAAQGATSKSKEFDWRWMIGTPMGAERRSNSTLDRGIVVTSVRNFGGRDEEFSERHLLILRAWAHNMSSDVVSVTSLRS